LTPTPGATAPVTDEAPLNINTATREDLIALPLIGSWSADKIIVYRDANGPFSSIWALTSTGAVDSWTVQQLEPLITVH
jgi:competence protein ComEA